MRLDHPSRRRTALLVGLAAAATLLAAQGAAAKPPKPDLATSMSGVYHGDVISNSQGSGHPDVTLTLTKVGPNTVSITSDYPRLPVVKVKLESAMSHVVNRSGTTAFAWDGKQLDVSFNNEVSWSGHR